MKDKLEEYKIDKSDWGEGPWQQEPDRVDFTCAGFSCLILRHPSLGHYCGYVGVPEGHPAYQRPYDDVNVEFHGGLTYSQACYGDVCHVPEPGMPDEVWWLGGDFAHCWDVSPGVRATLRSLGMPERDHGEVYRDLSYVRREVEELAGQLRSMAEQQAP